jgi:hypothetical protein
MKMTMIVKPSASRVPIFKFCSMPTSNYPNLGIMVRIGKREDFVSFFLVGMSRQMGDSRMSACGRMKGGQRKYGEIP